MIPVLCKVLGHRYAYNWVCLRCGDHAGFKIQHVVDLVKAAVQEAKRDTAPAPKGGE
jgi:hypothetical protein